ncbi:peroxisomal membrane anchor protein conserved region-domain-containing protein [Syncephalastrum racemosum]|uniref:Peroxisomal membrane protein PEX14 n=1 Tax=Syncephalastrum racemosum TaxID=13706 RepID=A0A1X2H525_SYNRA|nr:peroxisomal membrane anchor protein conserved region-domain-containing protein [Syncephalastrum racemosum]
MREDLIQSAVSFLADPKVQSAPLAKKVSFLESKGMTSEEINEAMSRANGTSSSAATTATASAPGLPPQAAAGGQMVIQPPPVPQRPSYDWRDIFIAAVLAGGVGYGVWTLAKRVFGPWFKVPTSEELEEDKEKLDAQFQAVEDSLKEIKDQTNDALVKVSSQSDKVDESLAMLEGVLKDLKQGDALRDDEFKSVKADVDSLKELVPKMLDRNKEAQSAVLNDLQNEIKSLKSLLLARRPTTPGSSLLDQPQQQQSTDAAIPGAGAAAASSPATPAGMSPRLASALNSNNRAGIPAWQMAAANKSSPANGTSSSATNNAAAAATATPSSSSSSSSPSSTAATASSSAPATNATSTTTTTAEESSAK